MTNYRPDDVLSFWFGSGADYGKRHRRWFEKEAVFDAEIKRHFLGLYETLAGNGDWLHAPKDCLARIVVLDQFSRNMFRGTARAFASDAAALHTAQIVVAAGWDAQLPTRHHRVFCYLPFEHSEALSAQDESIRLYTRLRDEEGDADPLIWAEKHREIVARFGRFPHRNEALGRVSTPEEVEFLKQPGSSF